MSREINLALVQMEPALGDIKSNLEQIIDRTRSAASAKADLVIFPELALTGCDSQALWDDLVDLSMQKDDDGIRRLCQLAGEEGVYLAAGFIEKRTIPGVLYNSVAFCGPDGALIGTYAKTHLFTTENIAFRHGSTFDVFRTKYGLVGPMICMDIGYPEVARILSVKGAELLFSSSAWITDDEDMWELSLRARALDNVVFVAGVDRVGKEGSWEFIGQSMMVDPRGHVIAKLGGGEEALFCSIDLDQVAVERRRALHWTGRHPELYSDLLRA